MAVFVVGGMGTPRPVSAVVSVNCVVVLSLIVVRRFQALSALPLVLYTLRAVTDASGLTGIVTSSARVELVVTAMELLDGVVSPYGLTYVTLYVYCAAASRLPDVSELVATGMLKGAATSTPEFLIVDMCVVYTTHYIKRPTTQKIYGPCRYIGLTARHSVYRRQLIHNRP